ncbi:MGMT family protein [Salinisphaera hydrothermalis]|uniref:Methyltransferase n=1 Tax=Salinisphaera hydrothermalis (strain C41B8) TaxID=1304275 RepID=A0A084IQF4_SALHC|nr:MGMT family protein [Salinisphaera hydrothermalis]KEZ78938.1 methyltransferase [Salinisphaera hydrothermalis C41B8]
MSSPLSHERIFAVVRRIPLGRVATYGQIARLVGRPRAARQIGYAMHRCPPGLPWHRVINAQGRISLPPDSTSALTQRRRLIEEGVVFIAGRVDLTRYGWDDGDGPV